MVPVSGEPHRCREPKVGYHRSARSRSLRQGKECARKRAKALREPCASYGSFVDGAANGLTDYVDAIWRINARSLLNEFPAHIRNPDEELAK